MKEILELLQKDARLTAAQIAVMLGKSETEVAAAIAEMEENKTILGYKPLINWDKTDKAFVSALIELRVTPQKGEGFDQIAERINQFPQVKSVFLMSGAFDLTVLVEGKDLKEVALFVSEKLATMDNVLSTATHFMLKTYKSEGVVFASDEKDQREVITL